jgi:hypothetical protein
MILDIDSYVKTLESLKITANQFLLCYLLYTDKKVQEGDKEFYAFQGQAIANLYRYATKVKTWTTEEIQDLIDKKYLIDNNKTDKKYPDYLEISDDFKQQIFTSETQFEEFWREYPAFIDNFNSMNGPKIKLKVTDPLELEEIYKKTVRTRAEHDRLMKVLKWSRDNNQLNINIKNFVVSRHWIDLEKEMNKYTISTTRLGN